MQKQGERMLYISVTCGLCDYRGINSGGVLVNQDMSIKSVMQGGTE